MQANFLIDLGDKAQVPIISFSATTFGWREVVPIYVDNEFGVGIIPFLTDALEKVNARVPYRSAIPSMATDDQIVAELYKLMTMQTRVFIVLCADLSWLPVVHQSKTTRNDE
ncbi:glutamate receptor 2.6 [Forsythia ovata]|uniref:Glutamate receptor 2.6 n=1 Tax=Forsythia ovata TaxID=205694 RepID=A0ABD1WF31_9LAMI